jgi:hypothetical protein
MVTQRVIVGALIAATVITARTATADPLLGKLLPFRHKVEADPDGDYRLTEDDGPWLIMTASFNGDGAAADARRLVLELRERYGLAAYWHAQSFDLVGDRDFTYDRNGRPKKIRYQQGEEVRQYAVLVGDFSSVDDPKARKTMDRIKYDVVPDSLTGQETDRSSLAFASFRKLNKMFLRDGDVKKSKGPLGHSFITTNPLLPKEYFSPSGIDSFVDKINSDIEYSLLDCNGKYTVKVATFNGNSQILSSKSSGDEDDDGSRLQDGGRKAHVLTLALRSKGFEAYEFHDRESSIVTVGSFSSPGRQLPNGGLSVSPAIQQVIDAFRAERTGASAAQDAARRIGQRRGLGGYASNGLQPKTLRADGKLSADYAPSKVPTQRWKGEFQEVETIPFDMMPTVIEVPRRSISSDYAHSRGS